MKIRNATITDIDQINTLWLESAKYHQKFDKEMYSNISKKDIQEHSESIIKSIKDPTRSIIVITQESNVIGYILGIIIKRKKEKTGILADMMITKKFQRKGLGSILIKNILNFFKKKNCTKSTLNVFENNIIAINAYTKFGFKKHICTMQKKL